MGIPVFPVAERSTIARLAMSLIPTMRSHDAGKLQSQENTNRILKPFGSKTGFEGFLRLFDFEQFKQFRPGNQ